jgi:hypothetical protein
MTTKSKSNVLKIGWYQIIGGGFGGLLILSSLFSSIQLSGLEVSVHVFSLLFFGYSIFSGIICIKYKKNALTHSLINQFLQLIGFAFAGVAFSYAAGINLYIGFDITALVVKFGFSLSELNFNLNLEHERAEIYLNLVALGMIYWISNIWDD